MPESKPLTIPAVAAVTIPSGATLTVPAGGTLTNEGTIRIEEGGALVNMRRVIPSGPLRRP